MRLFREENGVYPLQFLDADFLESWETNFDLSPESGSPFGYLETRARDPMLRHVGIDSSRVVGHARPESPRPFENLVESAAGASRYRRPFMAKPGFLTVLVSEKEMGSQLMLLSYTAWVCCWVRDRAATSCNVDYPNSAVGQPQFPRPCSFEPTLIIVAIDRGIRESKRSTPPLRLSVYDAPFLSPPHGYG